MASRKYLVGVVAAVLLIWGPLDHSWPAWMAIRIGYLILVPLATWFLLGWIWRKWQPSPGAEKRLQRSLAATTAGVLLVLAIIEAIADTHVLMTEHMDEGIVVTGPNWLAVILLLIVSVYAFRFSMSESESDQ